MSREIFGAEGSGGNAWASRAWKGANDTENAYFFGERPIPSTGLGDFVLELKYVELAGSRIE